MKTQRYIILFALIGLTLTASAQDFDKNLASARSAYSAGNLGDARFAMEQMLNDLDAVIGKEILKLLPAQVGSLKPNTKEDRVTGSSAGYTTGLYVHREYNQDLRKAELEIINNSPMMNSIGAILNSPMAGMMRDENQKTIKVQGYKSLLTKHVDSDTGKTDYELQIPMNNTLLTIKANDSNEGEITGYANAIPLAKIAQIAQ